MYNLGIYNSGIFYNHNGAASFGRGRPRSPSWPDRHVALLYAYRCVYISLSLYIYIYTYMYMYMCVHIYIYIYTHIRSYTYIYIYVLLFSVLSFVDGLLYVLVRVVYCSCFMFILDS